MALGLVLNDLNKCIYNFHPTLVAQWVKTSVLAPVVHGVRVRVPARKGSVMLSLTSTSTPFRGPGGKANFSLCGFQKLRLPRVGPFDTSFAGWTTQPTWGIEPQMFWPKPTHSMVWAIENYLLSEVKLWPFKR